jgi:hypothetical protein
MRIMAISIFMLALSGCEASCTYRERCYGSCYEYEDDDYRPPERRDRDA